MKIKTNKQLVTESQDYINPIGNTGDNHASPDLLIEVENYFGRKLDLMDLGCAGGQFVVDANVAGNLAVGVDGVDHVLNNSQTAGYHNWSQFYDKYFFLADMGQHFELQDDNDVLHKFDLISAWEVVEHIFPENMDNFLTNVKNHLKEGGLFIGSISGYVHQWHPSASLDRDMWTNKFEKNGLTFEHYKFENVLRRDILDGSSILFFARLKQ